MFLKALANLKIEMDNKELFKGNLIKFLKAIDNGSVDIPSEPPKEQLHVALGNMYTVDMGPAACRITMDADAEEIYALVDMLSDAATEFDQIPGEIKAMIPIWKGMIPKSMSGFYQVLYDNGEVNVDGSHVSGFMEIPFGLDNVHKMIADQEAITARNLAAYESAGVADAVEEGTGD
jgi:hypothetical protein